MKLRIRQAALVISLAAALTGCQSLAGPGGAAEVRVIVASPNAPGVDLYAGRSPVAYNLAFGNVTTYIAVQPGAVAASANTTGTRQVLTLSGATLESSARYTILLGDTIANLQMSVLRDQNTLPPTGHIALRFLDQATVPTPVDVYLLAPGALPGSGPPLLTGQTFGANSGYLNVPAGAYRIVLAAAGSSPGLPMHTGPVVDYAPGAVRTVILLDQRNHPGSPVQMITATDFDAPG